MKLSGRSVLVVGLGESGYQAARVARRLGARVKVIDSSREPSRSGRIPELESLGVLVEVGVDTPDDLHSFDLAVASPGVPDSAPVLREVRKRQVEVISEIELAYHIIENDIVAVTGTNGKTTTTELIARILDREGRSAYACGNIGTPMVSLLGKAAPTDILVAEVSSFQLQNIREFRARVAVALNFSADHFDWHLDIDEYRAAKMRLTQNMLPGDFLVYNREDPFCAEMAEEASGTIVGFGTRNAGHRGIWVEKGWVEAGPPLLPCSLLPVEEVKLPGSHNLMNVMAACGVAMILQEDPGRIREVVAGFGGLPHRMERVGSVHGVSFYNDSKATNPHATLKAIEAFEEELVLIMGGRNKGLDMTEVAGEISKRVDDGRIKGLVLMGESAGEIREGLLLEGGEETAARLFTVERMDDAVRRAFELAGGNGVVILSPACASFDMFEDYRDRGRAFVESVKSLERSEAVANQR